MIARPIFRSSTALGLNLVVAAGLMFANSSRADNVPVTTQHNNNQRTGANLQETILTTSNVRPGQFGKIWSYPSPPVALNGRVGGQPLYVPGVSIPNIGTRNVVYIGTSANELIAVDADSGAELWKASFNTPGLTSVASPPRERPLDWKCTVADGGAGCNDKPLIGIMSTPVIDMSSGILYVVSKHKRNDFDYVYLLHGVNMTSGTEHWPPRVISGSVPGHAENEALITVEFNSMLSNQRASLLLANGKIYIGFGSWQDTDLQYHGWVFAYPTDLGSPSKPDILCTTPHAGGFFNFTVGARGGVWQAGAGPVADGTGNVYVMTGNGRVGSQYPGTFNVGQSFVKLGPSLSILGQLPDIDGNGWEDADLGSSGPILLGPFLIGAGKTGRMHVVDISTMKDAQEVIQVTEPQPFYFSHHIHGSPAFWPTRIPTPAGKLYVWPEDESLKAYDWDGSMFRNPTAPTLGPKGPPGMPGGTLSVSANGSTAGTAIVWVTMPVSQDALHANVPGVLRAFDASNISNEIWNSEMNSAHDMANIFSKGANPTIANGKVFVGAQDYLNAYGIICTPTPLACPQGSNCGTINQGCGLDLSCGPPCTIGNTCANNVCVCQPRSCTGHCGALDDGCGHVLSCGGCGTKQNCCPQDGTNVCQTQLCN